ncbi:excinuclease ABC subunit UvrC [Peptoniphilus sp. KCTC 25270]|uniref:excinuclease ABC subunit UvrC n=1 Tax=Peptoniphilus sp. KCTC 25270 TaxID=2897414 RepID=UPI001E2C65F8|nr:excinuclease ABC subunit UvrC [Peptoniphilus sp. KCTC 25270]MCD1146929.1 excinuclease ABC subunit UvrC [Peptoniphilus sp. KCTC 25270]
MNTMISEKLKQLPQEPGVYLMRDGANQIIYVGKAKNLRNRVRQYFGSYGKSSIKVQTMVSQIKDFEYIIVQNELESLILESNLIKEYHPKYNILLRDDKQYPYIKITTNEPFPRVIKTRNIQKDKAKYYGPYPNVLAVNDAIDVFHTLYSLRNCKLDLSKRYTRPCLNYFIGRCKGPCIGEIDEEEYGESIEKVLEFLDGKEEILMNTLREKMQEASKTLDFEKAAEYRDHIESLNTLLEKQIITDAASSEEFDIMHLARGEGNVCVQVFFYRQGKIMGREHFILDDPYKEEDQKIFHAFIMQFYQGSAYLPPRIYLPVVLEEGEIIEEYLTSKGNHKVQLVVPKVGEKKKILSMVKKNAIDMLIKHSNSYKEIEKKRKDTLKDLQELLGDIPYPHRIEAYDISNISGVESVGSMVVFEEGRAKKTDYRRFRIKTIQGADDYGSLKEVLFRRFSRGLEEKKSDKKRTSFGTFPDLILMDGGKGQVSSAMEVLNLLELDIEVAGLVKDDFHKTKGIIYQGKEIPISKNSNIYKIIYQIQEEAHRFAITYHRSLRSKSTFRSELDEISNVGSKRKKNLMKYFQSIEKIKKATLEELLQVDGMNQLAAKSIIEHFHGGKDED